MGDAHPALQQRHRVLVEHVAHKSIALVHAQLAAVCGGDASGVLAAVLEHGQPVVELCRDFSGSDDADDAAHGVLILVTTKRLLVAARNCCLSRKTNYGCGRTMPSMPS